MAEQLFLIDGNSLAYRAFFALPESIATSTGVPTNAIFGFASMLVKILTDYGPKATVVVWDAGSSGRKEVYTEYKAQRSSRPDLLKEQWPHLEPLVSAFGYRNLKVDGFEADDVIASIAERAKAVEPPIEVMVVTGDRDAYQLVDDRVRIMTTSRGITDTRVYDREGVIDRYGIPPGAGPRLHRPQGRHQRQHPRRPRHRRQDRRRPAAALRDARAGARQRRSDQWRQAQAEPDRACRRRPDLQAAGHRQARHPARPRRHRVRVRAARPLAAARRLPGVRAARPAAAPRGGAGIGGCRGPGAGRRAGPAGAGARGPRERRREACRATPRWRSPCGSPRPRRGRCSERARSGASASTWTRATRSSSVPASGPRISWPRSAAGP